MGTEIIIQNIFSQQNAQPAIVAVYFTSAVASFDDTIVPSIQNMLTCAGVTEIWNFELSNSDLHVGGRMENWYEYFHCYLLRLLAFKKVYTVSNLFFIMTTITSAVQRFASQKNMCGFQHF